jgi:hypothetical protein
MKIVLVYLGKKLPKYAKKNVEYLSHTFPTQDFVLLIDHRNKFNLHSLKNLEILRVNDPFESWLIGNNILENGGNLQNDFWYKTLARFKVITDYMAAQNESVLHVEADVLLSLNFPFNLIQSIEENLAFPLINRDQAIASLLYIKDYNAAQKLLNFSEKALVRNPKNTDMDILGMLFKETPEDVFILPTIDPKSALVTHTFKSSGQIAGQHYAKFNGLFDGATLGQYFFGLDRIHTNGFLKTGIYLSHHFVDPRNVRILIKRKKFYVHKGDSTFELYNLHLHSKITKFFALEGKCISDFINKSNRKNLQTFSLLSYYRSKSYIIAHQIQKIRKFVF